MTNMLRTFGTKAAALTAFGDVLKGVPVSYTHLDEMAAIAGDSVKVTVTVSADEAALPHDGKKYL